MWSRGNAKKERGGRGGDESRGEEIGEVRGWKRRTGEAKKRRRGEGGANKVVILLRPILDLSLLDNGGRSPHIEIWAAFPGFMDFNLLNQRSKSTA